MTEKQNNWMANVHELFGGDCKIFTSNKSGGVYQLHVWVKDEGKMYRKSL